VKRYAALSEIHRAYQPRSYLEIGINTGRSLALSRTRTVAVDPAFKITSELHCDLHVVKAASDELFARPDGLAHLPDGRVDLAFVDGLHLFEFTLRDFMNVERHADWTSVIVVDDVLPRNVAEASRERGGMTAWTGDVFKLTEVLARYRPDLLALSLDTDPAGLLLVFGPNRSNRVLEEHYEEIVREYVYPDPQHVPEAIRRRETAIDAASVLYSGVWTELREARESGLDRESGWNRLRLSVEAAARPAERRELAPEPPRARGGAAASARRRLRPLRRRFRRRGGAGSERVPRVR
jgi:hypothetical protein